MTRAKVAKELADFCKVVAHPDRIRIIETLYSSAKDVSSLANELGVAGSRVSQHLSLLRAHRLVGEQRAGRQHIYHLTQPKLASWILEGLDFIEERPANVSGADIEAARRYWGSNKPTSKTG